MAGKGGRVTVTFKLERIKDEPAVTIISEIKRGHPVPEAKGSIFYAVGDGSLEKNDPRQLTMDFRVVPGEGLVTRTIIEELPRIKEVGE